MASTSSYSNLLTQTFHYRRLLSPAPPFVAAAPPAESTMGAASAANTKFDANAVMVLSLLLCALLCSLGLNSIVRCVSRCSNIVNRSDESAFDTSAKLANTGIKKKALKTFPIISYGADSKLPGLDTDCAICLSEFAAGDRVRVLPKCNHGFHVRCIDKWLNSHSSCPTCRHCLIQTCEKIVGCSTAAAATQQPAASAPPPVQEAVVIRIEPLNREGLIPNYHN